MFGPAYLLYGDDRDLAAVLAVIFKADLAINFREQRVVLAEADIESGLEAATLLTNENRSARYEHAVVALHAEPLRIAVAPVP